MTAPDGDAWVEGTLGAQLAALPGLRRLAWYKVLTERGPYTRVAEFWFEDYAAWRAAFLKPAKPLSAAPWGGAFPFAGAKSMFIGERPDIDFIHDERVIP